MIDYLKKIKKVITDKSGVDGEEVTENSYFQDDLNISEMELIEILSELEEEFHVDLLDQKEDIETVQELIEILTEQLE